MTNRTIEPYGDGVDSEILEEVMKKNNYVILPIDLDKFIFKINLPSKWSEMVQMENFINS